MLMCAKAGIIITGMNMEVSPGQGELQVCNIGIKACDNLIFLRYVLVRLGEDYNMVIDFSPKLDMDTKLNGSGCHINFSTKQMRDENGYSFIKKALDKLNLQETDKHLKYYGENNIDRLTGKNETSNIVNLQLVKVIEDVVLEFHIKQLKIIEAILKIDVQELILIHIMHVYFYLIQFIN